MDVLFEETHENVSCGYTKNYIKVCVDTELDITSKILSARLTDNLGNMAKGYIL